MTQVKSQPADASIEASLALHFKSLADLDPKALERLVCASLVELRRRNA